MRKTFVKLSLSLAFLAFFCNTSCLLGAEVGKEGIVRGSYINLRAEPKFNSQIVGKKLRGEIYTVKFEQQDWLKVKFKDETEGWIRKTLVESVANTDSVNNNNNKTNINTEKNNASDIKSSNTKEENKKSDKSSSKEKNKVEPDKPLIKPVNPQKLPEVIEFSGTAEELYNEAIKLYEKRKYSEALDKNKAANKKAPKNAEILNNIGNCQFKLGRIEDALSSWKEALKIAPRSGKICNNLGIAYYQLDKNKDAIEYYKKAILFESDFADPYYNIASVYGFTGEFEEALKYYRKFLEFNPDDTMKKLTDERVAYCEKQLSKKLR